MAGGRLNGWTDNIEKMFADYTEEKLMNHKRAAVAYLLSRIIQYSPVDTGAFRGGHRVTSVDPTGSGKDAPMVPAHSPQTVLADADKEVLSVPLFSPVYVANYLPYAVRLENGYSKQAVNGIYSLAMNDAIEKFKR